MSDNHSPLPWFLVGEHAIAHVDKNHGVGYIAEVHGRADLKHILRCVNQERSVTGILEAARGVVATWDDPNATVIRPAIYKLREELEKYENG